MVDAQILDRVAVAVCPKQLSGLRISRSNKNTHCWPDARSEVDNAVVNNRATSNRPERNQPTVSEVSPLTTLCRCA